LKILPLLNMVPMIVRREKDHVASAKPLAAGVWGATKRSLAARLCL
jgi:hypothetical protein